MPRRTLAAFDLKAARKARGLSQSKTAEILSATQPSVARWEALGNMPEVFRKVWSFYWQLEDMKHANPTDDKRVGKARGNARGTKGAAQPSARKGKRVVSAVEEVPPDDAATV